MLDGHGGSGFGSEVVKLHGGDSRVQTIDDLQGDGSLEYDKNTRFSYFYLCKMVYNEKMTV